MFVEEKAKGEVKELDAGSLTLLRAANIIEKKGHCNFASYGADGSLCVHAAIGEAAQFSSPTMSAAREKLEGRLGEGRFITTWSNSSTKAEVIAKLRAVALGY